MNFDAVCRTCLATGNLNPIYVTSADPKRFSVALFITTGIKVSIDDGLPQQMCARCITFTNDSLTFRKQCKNAQIRLLQAKQECDEVAEARNSRVADKGHCDGVDMQSEIKTEDIEADDNDITIKCEADDGVDEDVSGNSNESHVVRKAKALTEIEVDIHPLKHVKAGVESDCSHTHKEDQQQPELRISSIKIEPFSIDDSGNNLHTCEACLLTFDDVLHLSNHICIDSVEVNSDGEVYDEALKVRFERDNVKQGEDYFSEVNPSTCSLPRLFEGKHGSTSQTALQGPGGRKSPKQRRGLRRSSVRLQRLSATVDTESSLTSQRHEHTTSCEISNEASVKKIYYCDVCGKRFGHKRGLRGHMATHMERKSYTCVDCKKTTTSQSISPSLSCSFCTGKLELNLNSNKQKSEKQESCGDGSQMDPDFKPHCCDICNKGFNQLSNLSTHMRIHTGEKPFRCDTCNKSFVQLSVLNRHKRVHTGEQPYNCDICNKRFKHSFSLTVHMRIHTGEKPYSCDLCNKTFKVSNDLTKHKRVVHTGEKPYSCDICNKRFSVSNVLNRHKRVHTDEKPFTCDTCNKRFFTSNALDKHKQVHTGEKPYSCDTCNKRFSHAYSLTVHVRKHTGEKPYSCDTCKKSFAKLSYLTIHKRLHTGEKPYTCDTCDRQFTHLFSLTLHMRTHTGEKPFSCDTCKKRFRYSSSLTVHMRIHTGEKPYSCDICKKRFTESSSLTKHMKTHR